MKKIFILTLIIAASIIQPSFSQTRDIDMQLFRASSEGNLPEVRSLIRKGANVNATQSEGATPLIVAAFSGNLEVLQYLISCGAKVNVRDINGNTAIMQASYFGYLKVVELLVNSGGDPFVRNNEGHTAMEIAQGRHNDKVVSYLSLIRLQIMTSNK